MNATDFDRWLAGNLWAALVAARGLVGIPSWDAPLTSKRPRNYKRRADGGVRFESFREQRARVRRDGKPLLNREVQS